MDAARLDAEVGKVTPCLLLAQDGQGFLSGLPGEGTWMNFKDDNGIIPVS